LIQIAPVGRDHGVSAENPKRDVVSVSANQRRFVAWSD
jgi:hypothetical protein